MRKYQKDKRERRNEKKRKAWGVGKEGDRLEREGREAKGEEESKRGEVEIIGDVFPSGCGSEYAVALECSFLWLSHVTFIYLE